MAEPWIHVGVVEPQTFVARELITLLLRHPQVRITALQAEKPRAGELSELFGEFRGRDGLPPIEPVSADKLRESCHAVFLCLPHGEAMNLAPTLVEAGLRVFDFSSDFRFRDRDIYRKAFQREHPAPAWNLKAVYGLPELYRPDIIGASLVAMPGNYPTAVILALAPLLRREMIAPGPVVADCKGGYTTIDQLTPDDAHFSSASTNISPQYPLWRRQQPEIEEQLLRLSGERHRVLYVPHLVPVSRGTLATCYVTLREEMTGASIQRMYRDFYHPYRFIRLLDEKTLPRTTEVQSTNFCDIAVRLEPGGHQLIVMAALDNLGKGSAGQAIQCFNIGYGFDDREGLL